MIFPFNISNILIVILFILLIGLIYYIYTLNSKLNKFIIGKSSTNLDDSISFIKNSLAEREKFQRNMEDYLLSVEKRLKKSVQSVSTVRFNPFKGTGSGSNQSFSTTFLNEERDGVIISSLYSREHISVYSKPVVKGNSEYELSEEEKESLEKAKAVLK